MNTSFFRGNAIHKFLGAMVVAILIVGAYISVPHLFTTEKTEAHLHANVAGWAFAQGGGSSLDGAGIGWTSFNSDDCDTNNNNFIDTKCGGNDDASTPVDTTKNYGVIVNEADREAGGIGIFSGHAYAERIGYVSFNLIETGPPPNAGTPPEGADYSTWLNPHIAHVAWVKAGGGGGEVTGWARALVACDYNLPAARPPLCKPGAGLNAGGWDGWIKLSNGDDNVPATPHAWQTGPTTSGVKITANKFSGFAWGGAVMGWINFAPPGDVGPRITGGGVCAPSDPTFTAGSCELVACSVAGGEAINGWQIDSCTINGSTVTTAPKKCYPGGICPPPPPPPPCNNNGVCNLGESNALCPLDNCPVVVCNNNGVCDLGESRALCPLDNCPLPVGPCNGFACDGKCVPPENPKNSSDCKARWWQF